MVHLPFRELLWKKNGQSIDILCCECCAEAQRLLRILVEELGLSELLAWLLSDAELLCSGNGMHRPQQLETGFGHRLPVESILQFKRMTACEFFVKLQLQAEERGVVSIKGVSANRFLAMKEDGRLLALKCATEECFFFERLESNNYNTYRSRKYSDWYVALKRTGQYKPGPKTGPGQKAILFLPMSAKS
nr:fibroblast growth factor 2 [Columba livia]